MGNLGLRSWAALLALGLAGCPTDSNEADDEGPAGTVGDDDDDDDDDVEDETGDDDDDDDDDDDGPCVTNDDCALSPGLEVCDVDSGACVGCLDDDDCIGDLTCTPDNICGGCDGDEDCPLGTTCENELCLPGCGAAQPCPGGFACCAGACVDIDVDSNHCGECENVCAPADGASVVCEAGECEFDGCDEGFNNCNGDTSDGCETEGDCECIPGEEQACYTGERGTRNIGACSDGVQVCNDTGSGFGPCEGDTTPVGEICANLADDDCDGLTDEDPDEDEDGFTACGGDCCDEQGPDCLNPELVNPGAFEDPENEVDDDCDGEVDEASPTCDDGIAPDTAEADDFARAIDLCQFTEEEPKNPEDATWGVISAELVLTDGAGVPAANSYAVRDGFGANNMNQGGDRMAVLSSGHAADNFDDANPAYAAYQNGQNMGTGAPYPADWYAANGNDLPNAPGCPSPAGADANDPVMLRLRVRVPTNANSFTVNMNFFSSEYPEYVCTAFNDFFVTLVDSTDEENPDDLNIAIYDDGGTTFPVGVNILDAADGLFTECSNGTISQCGTSQSNYAGCTGTDGLTGTGFDVQGATSFSCGYALAHGGGTGWLTMSGNVTPGEIMEIRFAIWDSADNLFDSTVLLDNWVWSVQSSEPGVTPS